MIKPEDVIETGKWEGQPIWREKTPAEKAISKSKSFAYGVENNKKVTKDMRNATDLLGKIIDKLY